MVERQIGYKKWIARGYLERSIAVVTAEAELVEEAVISDELIHQINCLPARRALFVLSRRTPSMPSPLKTLALNYETRPEGGRRAAGERATISGNGRWKNNSSVGSHEDLKSDAFALRSS
ncbi:hypothetical protein HPP92_010558 [Vanilla planifolia]|uniref:Uncharacterized protein n=1 Tax=Vanilla planifolia TaxID=51239 RepID=A0A835R5C8_VANPL|nr:hypothetical protein HPP92_010558 [Vanilla planifolia]